MVLVCPHCARANLPTARFCHYDGIALLANGQAPPASARHTFLTPFVFSSGRECSTYDDFAQACLQHWDEAVALLHKGFLQAFFGGLGRMDLMQTAQEAAAFPDQERGLDLLLARLPTHSLPAPKLDVQPKLIDLGTLKYGQNSQVVLHLDNQSQRLVFGSISSSCKWLAVTDTGEARLFQTRQSTQLTVQVKGQHLRAALKPLEGSLLVESNAGTFNLKVIVQVAIQPYPDGVLAGARTPRELAEKAKHAPRQAAPFFECGAVAKWYQSNGWTYPVQGPAATGLAAVQQFFEALGVSKPPKVRVSDQRLFLQGKPGEKIVHRLQLLGEENRPVYAHGTCAEPWLVVRPAVLQGTTATLAIEIAVPRDARTALQATLKIQANGQQQFEVPVMVALEAAETASTIAPPSMGRREIAPQQVAPSGGKRWLHAVPLAMLGSLLIGLMASDALTVKSHVPLVQEEPQEELHSTPVQEAPFKVAIQDEPEEVSLVPVARFKIEDEPEERFLKLPPPVKVEIKDEPDENNAPGALAPIATTPLVSYQYGTSPKRFGISCTSAAGGAGNKLLTYSGTGDTNSTVVKVAGRATEFGSTAGRWTRINKALLGVKRTEGAVLPSHSTWTFDRMTFHQVLEVVPGQPVTVGGTSRRQLDSVLVRWIIHNDSKLARTAGLRLQLDTLIGSNDGVPFTVPGNTGLVSTFADFTRAQDVPDFIQALEFPSLRNPGTVAHLTLKSGGAIEPPGRVSLTRWPGNSLAWDIPVIGLASDSAVVLYWPEKKLPAGESRTIGFAYGLGNVSSNDKLGVTLGGSFEPGQHFTVSAYVENPIAKQTLQLELPAGLRRVEGEATQKVAPSVGGRNTSIVTWKVQVERTGEFRLKVISSTGLSQAKTISIAQGTVPTGGKLRLDLQGSFEPGQTFTVQAKVTEPLEKQTLTLHLPTGLEKTEGTLTQPVPAPSVGSKEALVQWQVRVREAGKYPVRVSSSNGIAQTKTVTIVQPGRVEGSYQVLLLGEFAPGKTFSVSSRVVNPALDQKLTLLLPAGLERIDGTATQVVQAGMPLVWNVKILEAGKYTIGVKSTTGVTQRKTLRIEPPESARGGRFQFDLTGEIRPGKEFDVKAQVTDPVPGQTLTLILPKELELTKGDKTQPATAVVAWKVRVLESGSLRVRVASSTGVTRAKTIQLTGPKVQPLFTP